jgi:hypothetical protein
MLAEALLLLVHHALRAHCCWPTATQTEWPTEAHVGATPVLLTDISQAGVHVLDALKNTSIFSHATLLMPPYCSRTAVAASVAARHGCTKGHGPASVCLRLCDRGPSSLCVRLPHVWWLRGGAPAVGITFQTLCRLAVSSRLCQATAQQSSRCQQDVSVGIVVRWRSRAGHGSKQPGRRGSSGLSGALGTACEHRLSLCCSCMPLTLRCDNMLLLGHFGKGKGTLPDSRTS